MRHGILPRIWIRMIRGFHPLLAVLVERWRPETHTFVLSVGEVTVTLEDVTHIFGLPIDGEPVSGWTDSSSDFVQSHSMAIFEREPVLSHAEPLDTEESIRRYVRCQIFCMLGSTLFTDKLTAYAHANWGLACLTHLYRALCRASRYDTKEMDGPLNLLWSHSERSTTWLEKTVVTFRHDIDYMQEVNIYGSN
ncbi:hypothetical protein AHAS_Ahas07G0051600 [Arachis hypogaea]